MTEQFSARDVTIWGVLALCVWAVALVGSTLSLQVPDAWLAGLHSTRLGGASMSQLRGQLAELEAQASELKQQNTVLLQRFMLNEQANGQLTRRVGALELS